MPQTPISITDTGPSRKTGSSKTEAHAPLSAKGNRRDLVDYAFAQQKPLVPEREQPLDTHRHK